MVNGDTLWSLIEQPDFFITGYLQVHFTFRKKYLVLLCITPCKGLVSFPFELINL